MKFRITGADCENGDVVEVTVVAPTSAEARDKARALGVVALTIEDADLPQSSEPLQPIVMISPAAPGAHTALNARQPSPWAQHSHQGSSLSANLRRGVNMLGTAAIIFGILGLLLCWIPFLSLLSLPLSLIGVVLAGIGAMVRFRHDVSPVGVPIAGAAVSVVAAIIAVITGAAPIAALSEAPSTASQRTEHTETSSNPTPTPVAIGAALDLGGIALTLDAVDVGPLALRNSYSATLTPTDTAFLIVRITVKNASVTKRLGPIFASGMITDTHNNSYKEISPYGRFGSSRIDGLPHSSDALYPGDSVGQWIIFDRPVDETSALRLSLSILERASTLQTNELASVRWQLPAPSHR